MIVNSWSFLLFFAVVFLVYFSPKISQRSSWQNIWMVLASYFFYGFVDWKMLPILFGVTLTFYFLGIWLKKIMNQGDVKTASRITTLGVVIGVAILLYFKYLNFFADSFASLLTLLGVRASWSTLNIVLPVGVSFFTFKLISYIIEIHREKIQPSRNFLEFATYISFFPTILSGPIDRPSKFLPQLQVPHRFNFNMALEGCQQIIWGIFTKMIIADNLSNLTSMVWNDYSIQQTNLLLWAILLSPIQVYADFDGYSNMAIGVGKVLGYDITKNFNHPLLARNVSEYWRRWHISLTGWITDYVFMPLNIIFRNFTSWGLFLAITINLVVIGLWHGANWTYAIFGLYHSLLFIPLLLLGSFGKNKKLKSWKWGLPHLNDMLLMFITYLIIGIGHVIFFAPNLHSVVVFWSTLLFNDWNFNIPTEIVYARHLIFALALVPIEWITRTKEFPLQRNSHNYYNNLWKIFFVDLFIALLLSIFASSSDSFVYFKF